MTSCAVATTSCRNAGKVVYNRRSSPILDLRIAKPFLFFFLLMMVSVSAGMHNYIYTFQHYRYQITLSTKA